MTPTKLVFPILSRTLMVVGAAISLVNGQDTDLDGIPDLSDPLPTVNAVVADPDGNHNLPASLATGLVGRWDNEQLTVTGINHRIADLAGGDQPLDCRQLSMSLDNSGMISKAAFFDGGNDHLAAPGNLFHNLAAFSTTMWFKMTPNYVQNKFGNIHTVFFACNDTLDAYPELIVSIYKAIPGSTTQKITVNRYNGTTVSMMFYGEVPVGSYVDDGLWHHLAYVKNGNNNRLFMDGIKLKESNSTNGNLSATSAGYLSFGKNFPVASDPGHTFRGSMDRLRFYSRAISDAEVTALHRQDSDRDGFPDFVENKWTGHKPMSPFYWQGPGEDTDGDGIPDGYEIANGLNPLSPTGRDGANADNDNDGLSNFDEYQHLTNPNRNDTDGDGKIDGLEITQASDPANAADQGLPPSDPLEDVKFTLGGDYATWEMTIKGLGPRDTRVLKVVSKEFSFNFTTQNRKLWKNNKYEVSLKYLRTIPGQNEPWFCWQTQIEDWPANTSQSFDSNGNQIGARNSLNKSNLIKSHWIVDNQAGLLTGHIHSKGAAGNKAGTLKAFLLPVDLDIVHPVTGELADANEDIGDGGYVSVQRLEDPANSTSDVTPKTKLKIHAISGAQSTLKTRLKFSGGDRYKIYLDEARRQEVVSEQTEFNASQETTLFFHGLKKSLARGGDKVTMQIKLNDTWIDSDSVKYTIVQSEFLIQVKAFIPYAWTEAEEEVPGPNGISPMVGKVAKGDLHPGLGDRATSPGFLNVYSTDKELPPGPVAPGTSIAGLFTYAPFRCCQTIILTPYRELHSSYDLQSKRKEMTAPSSDHFIKATSVNAAELSLKKGYMALIGGTSKTGKGPITTKDYRQGARAGKVAELHIEFGGKDGALGSVLGIPISWGAADIHWDMWLKVNSEVNPILPTIEFGGKHDRYPAYEIIVIQSNGTYKPIHNVLPAAGALPGPISLDNNNALNVGRLDTIRD